MKKQDISPRKKHNATITVKDHYPDINKIKRQSADTITDNTKNENRKSLNATFSTETSPITEIMYFG